MYLPVDWPVPDLVSCRAQTAPGRTALVDAETGRSWTYRELSEGPVESLAAGIRGAGLAPGDHLGVLLEPGTRMAQLVHAAARAGVVFVPLSPDTPPEVLADRCRVADVEAVVCGPGSERSAVQAFDGPVFTVGEREDGELESLWQLGADSSSAYWWERAETQWLVSTSGTTGDARAVKLTTSNLVASATASAFRLGVRPDDRWLACLPTHHVGGLAPFIRSALYGTAVVAQPGFDVNATSSAMVRFDVTGVSLVPTMLQRLLDNGWTPPQTLRFVLLGGAPASRELIERCAAAEVPVCPTYGATETASQVATAKPAEAAEHPGSVGRPLRGIEIGVRDGEGDPRPSGEPGELVVSGPVVTPGYYGDDQETNRRIDGSGFWTRDRGYRDDAGRLWVIGRLDDAIVTGGVTVHPADVEAVLREYPAVDEVAIVGLADEEWGEVVCALVTASAAEAVDRAALRAHCRARLEPPAVPKIVVTVDGLPRTASGTVDRAAVSDRLRAARSVEDL